MQYIRSEITLIDYLLDNAAADVHLLINSQNNGSGGSAYQLIFFGQNAFSGDTDTLRFNAGPNATEFELRNLLLTYIKTGLTPFIAKTSDADQIEVSLKSSGTAPTTDSAMINDPWNAWVFRLGLDGNVNADANYRNTFYGGYFSGNRITDALKIGFGGNLNRTGSFFKFEDDTSNFTVKNHQWTINQYLVKSINAHWSWSYEVKYSQNTFSNNRSRIYLRAAAEYNIFPYKDVNTKLLTLSYGLTVRRNQYYHSTIYDKTKETLYGHMATAYLSLTQKWGNSYAGISYHNYFHNWKFFNLGVDVYSSVRITGGLSFYVFAFGGLTRDQVFLEKGNATAEEVLARRRQLSSGYNYFTSFGVTYRFGSQVNNVVNPRFDRSSSINQE